MRAKRKKEIPPPKVGRSPVDMKLDESDEDLGADSPLEMVRFALLQLSALEEGSAGGSVANITSLLQVCIALFFGIFIIICLLFFIYIYIKLIHIYIYLRVICIRILCASPNICNVL